MSDYELACKDLVDCITEYLEGTLSEQDLRHVEEHLADCEDCTAYLDQMRKTVTLTGHLTEEAISPRAREALLGVFHTWQEEQA